MRYRQHTIEAQYLPGADFKVVEGVVKPRKEDIEFYVVRGPNGEREPNAASLLEAKEWIDKWR